MEEDALVPVFTSTGEIEFPLTEKSPRQVITLYNPYGYSINYKVLCTAPSNYSVQESNGGLLAKCCKDIVVRCTTKLPSGNVDKLRIEIRKRGDSKLRGFRDILLKTVTERSPQVELAQNKNSFYGMTDSATAARSDDHRRGNENSQWGYVVTAILCAMALALPTSGDPNAGDSMVPNYLHLSLPQKLVASYILGVVSILILRPL